ncbi:DUF2188 domain-containing protein [Humibacter sp.]|uniref:DUF2188 domain-containing protein n=1 Tax=Humibacter sp. TaxID=1940291 RepID=UPI003F80B508
MSNPNVRHVVPNSNGGWDVKAGGAQRASAHTDTQARAQDRARTIIGNAGGGEMLMHGPDGQIRAKDTIAPEMTRATSRVDRQRSRGMRRGRSMLWLRGCFPLVGFVDSAVRRSLSRHTRHAEPDLM